MGELGEVQVSPLFTVQFYKAIPYSAFAFEGVAVVLPLRDIVEDQKGFFKVACFVVSGIAIIYIILFAEFTNMSYNFEVASGAYILTTRTQSPSSCKSSKRTSS